MSTTSPHSARETAEPAGGTSALSERVFGLVLLVLAVAALVHLAQLNPPELPGDPGPRLFPGIAAAGLGVCGALLCAFPPRGSSTSLGGNRHLGVLFLLTCVGYVALMQVAGYYVSTPVFIAVAFLVLSDPKEKRVVPLLITAAVVTTLVALVFDAGLGIVLPEGMF